MAERSDSETPEMMRLQQKYQLIILNVFPNNLAIYVPKVYMLFFNSFVEILTMSQCPRDVRTRWSVGSAACVGNI